MWLNLQCLLIYKENIDAEKTFINLMKCLEFMAVNETSRIVGTVNSDEQCVLYFFIKCPHNNKNCRWINLLIANSVALSMKILTLLQDTINLDIFTKFHTRYLCVGRLLINCCL